MLTLLYGLHKPKFVVLYCYKRNNLANILLTKLLRFLVNVTNMRHFSEQ